MVSTNNFVSSIAGSTESFHKSSSSKVTGWVKKIKKQESLSKKNEKKRRASGK